MGRLTIASWRTSFSVRSNQWRLWWSCRWLASTTQLIDVFLRGVHLVLNCMSLSMVSVLPSTPSAQLFFLREDVLVLDAWVYCHVDTSLVRKIIANYPVDADIIFAWGTLMRWRPSLCKNRRRDVDVRRSKGDSSSLWLPGSRRRRLGSSTQLFSFREYI